MKIIDALSLTVCILGMASGQAYSESVKKTVLIHPSSRSGSIADFDISQDEKRILTGGGSWKELFLWDLESGVLLSKLNDGTFPNYSVGLSSDGRWAAGSGAYSEARIWNLQTVKLVHRLTIDMDPSDVVRSLAFTPDSRRLLVTGGARASLWDVETGTLLDSYNGSIFHHQASFFPDGNRVFLTAAGGVIFDCSSETIIRSFAGGTSSLISHDFQRVLNFEAGDFGTAIINEWDVETGELILRTSGLELSGESDVSPNGDFYVRRVPEEKKKLKVKKWKPKEDVIDIDLTDPFFDPEKPIKPKFSKSGNFIFFSQGDYAFLYDIRELKSKIKDDKVYDDPPKKE